MEHETPGNLHVAQALAKLYRSTQGSDCYIEFCKEQNPPCAGQKRLANGLSDSRGVRARDEPCQLVEPLPAHTFVLKLASERFRAQLEGWCHSEGGHDAGARVESADPKAQAATLNTHVPTLRVPLSGPEELPSARAAVAFAYTGRVPAGSIQELVAIWRQAEYLQIEGCAATCIARIKAKLAEGSKGNGEQTKREAGGGSGSSSGSSGAGGSDAEALPPVLELFACEALWAHLSTDATLQEAARAAIASYFVDALQVLNDPTRRRHLLCLPAERLGWVLESGDLRTDDESSVLLLLATWMAANYGATSAEERRRLCAHVRLAQVGCAYAAAVLPALARDFEDRPDEQAGWFPVTLQEVQVLNLLGDSRCCDPERMAWKALARRRFNHGGADPGCQWYNLQRRMAFRPQHEIVLPWHVSCEDLVRGLESEEGATVAVTFDTGLSGAYARGFKWTPCLVPGSDGVTAGVFLQCEVPEAYTAAPGSRVDENLVAVACVAARIDVFQWRSGVKEVPCSVEIGWRWDYCRVGGMLGAEDALQLRRVGARRAGGDGNAGRALLLAAWGDYLHEDRVSGTLTLLGEEEPRYVRPMIRGRTLQ